MLFKNFFSHPKITPKEFSMATKMRTETKEVRMANQMFLEVQLRYMNYYRGCPDFNFDFSLPDFKRYFAEVAHMPAFNLKHHNGKFRTDLTSQEREDRHYYNRYFGLVRDMLSAYLKEEKKKALERALEVLQRRSEPVFKASDGSQGHRKPPKPLTANMPSIPMSTFDPPPKRVPVQPDLFNTPRQIARALADDIRKQAGDPSRRY